MIDDRLMSQGRYTYETQGRIYCSCNYGNKKFETPKFANRMLNHSELGTYAHLRFGQYLHMGLNSRLYTIVNILVSWRNFKSKESGDLSIRVLRV